MTTIEPQVLIGTRYRIAEPIGQGVGSAVYRADDTVLNRAVALKVVDPAFISTYRASMAATARIGHPAYVGIFDAIEYEGRLVIVQELVAGQRFADLARADLDVATVARIGRQLALALAHAHRQGIVHGDITPAALFRDQWGALRVNSVMLPANAEYFARAGRLLASGAEPWVVTMPTFRDDLRAVGVALWLLLAGRDMVPTEATGLADDWALVGREVPETLRDIIERLTDPEHPRALDSAEGLISALSGGIRTLETPRASRGLKPPWESPRDSAVGVPTARRPVERPKPSVREIPAPGLRTPTTGTSPVAAGPLRPSAHDDDMTWKSESDALAGRYASRPPEPPTGGRLDIALWVGLGIAVFLFWLVVGYLVPGLLGK